MDAARHRADPQHVRDTREGMDSRRKENHQPPGQPAPPGDREKGPQASCRPQARGIDAHSRVTES